MRHQIYAAILALAISASVGPTFAQEQTGWGAPENVKRIRNPVPVTQESLRKGKEIYEMQCATCHGFDGNGRGPISSALNPRPPSFRTPEQMEMPDGEAFWKLLTGRGEMPSFNKELSKKEIWSVINYIHTLQK